MIKFFLFLKKIHFLLLFIILEMLALHYYANSTSYAKVRLVTASNYVVGGIYAQLSGLNNFFHLRGENRKLNAELAEAYNRLDRLTRVVSEEKTDSSSTAFAAVLPQITDSLSLPLSARHYAYYPARVINNSVMRQENYLTLDRGVRDGIRPDMALVSERGIVGYVLGCSSRFSVCMSVLNRNFRTSGRIKGNNYFGSVFWDGLSYQHVTLTEIPKYAAIETGDTIVTTNFSSIFPPDLMIGTVETFTLVNATYYEVKVKLHTDFGALNNLMVVDNLDREEEEELEQSVGIVR